MTDRAGKTFVVTGGASGLGEACVRALSAQGANVAILDRDVEKGTQIASELGPRALFCEVDATKEETIAAAIESTFAKFGSIHGSVACAGVGAATTTLDKKGAPHNSGIFDFVQQCNLYGVFNTCKYVAAKMIQNPLDESGCRGVLINIASVAGIDGQKGQVAYAASKGKFPFLFILYLELF